MKTTMKLTVLVAVISSLLASCATAPKAENPLAGTWREVDGTRKLHFSRDGTVRVIDGDKSAAGRYAMRADWSRTEAPWRVSDMEFDLGTPVTPAKPMIFMVGVSPDYLNLTAQFVPNSKTAKFKREH